MQLKLFISLLLLITSFGNVNGRELQEIKISGSSDSILYISAMADDLVISVIMPDGSTSNVSEYSIAAFYTSRVTSIDLPCDSNIPVVYDSVYFDDKGQKIIIPQNVVTENVWCNGYQISRYQSSLLKNHPIDKIILSVRHNSPDGATNRVVKIFYLKP